MTKINVLSERDMNNLLRLAYGQYVTLIHTIKNVSSISGSETVTEANRENVFIFMILDKPHWTMPDLGYFEQQGTRALIPARYSVKKDDLIIHDNRMYFVKAVRAIEGTFDNVTGVSEKTMHMCFLSLKGDVHEETPPHINPVHQYEIKYGLGTWNSRTGVFTKVGAEQTKEARFDMEWVNTVTTASGQVLWIELPPERKFVELSLPYSRYREDRFLRVAGTRIYHTTTPLRANIPGGLMVRTYPQSPTTTPDQDDTSTLTSLPDLSPYVLHSGTLQAGGRMSVRDNFGSRARSSRSYGRHVFWTDTPSGGSVNQQERYFFEIPDGMTLLQIKRNNVDEPLSGWTEVPGSVGYTRYYRNEVGLNSGTTLTFHAYIGNVPTFPPTPSLDNNDWLMEYGVSDNNGNVVESSKREILLDGNLTEVIGFPYVSQIRPAIWFKLPEGRKIRKVRFAGSATEVTYVRKGGTREFYSTFPFRLSSTPNYAPSLSIDTRTSSGVHPDADYLAPEDDTEPPQSGWYKIKYGSATHTGEKSPVVRELNFQNYRLPLIFMPSNSTEYPAFYFEIPSDYAMTTVLNNFFSDVTSLWLKVHEDNKVKRYLSQTRYRAGISGIGLRPVVSPP